MWLERTIGVARVIRAAPDGYTLSAGNSTSHVGGPAIYPFSHDILNDLEPIALLTMSPTMLVARKAATLMFILDV